MTAIGRLLNMTPRELRELAAAWHEDEKANARLLRGAWLEAKWNTWKRRRDERERLARSRRKDRARA